MYEHRSERMHKKLDRRTALGSGEGFSLQAVCLTLELCTHQARGLTAWPGKKQPALSRFRELVTSTDRERKGIRGAGSLWPVLRATLKQGGQVRAHKGEDTQWPTG